MYTPGRKFFRVYFGCLVLFSAAGCVMQPEIRQSGAAWVPSPNFDERRPNFVIIHGTTSDTVDHALRTLTDPERKVSAHYLIGRDGAVIQLVDERMRAWHAGASRWGMLSDLNSASIGIELEYPAAPASPPWPQVQLDAAVAHVRGLVQIYQVPRANMLRHAEVDPKNRSDPRSFPWQDFVARVYHGIDDALADTLRNAAWNAGGIPFNREAAFPRYAREHGLGNPETPEFDFGIAGQQYRGQGFSRGIIYARVGEWGDIREVIW